MQKRKKPSNAKLENTKKSPKGKAFIFYWNIGTNAFFLTSLYIYIYILLLLFNNLQTSHPHFFPLFLVPLYWNTTGTAGTSQAPHEKKSDKNLA